MTNTQPTEQDIKAWYNQRYASRGVDSMRTADAYPVFLDDLRAESGRSLLDIACGTGYLLAAADQRGLKTWGVDISEEAVKLARQVSPRSTVAVGKGEDLRFPDGQFDYITCIGSLEHFLDMERGLAEMKRVTGPEALLCILVPNSNFLYWKFAGQHGTEQQDINEHLMSFREWRDFFERNGLAVVRTRQDRWPIRRLRPFASANPLKIVKGLVFKLVWTLLPMHYAYQFVFVLRKSGPART
jgi:SAM-dependent methyltransferase